MISTNDFKRGLRIEIDDEPYVVVDVGTQSPSARSANTLVKTKVRNLKTGQLLDRAFKAGERVREPDFEIRTVQYLYDEDGEMFFFMDQETYDQFPLSRAVITDQLDYIRPNDEVRALFFNSECIGIEVPPTVVLEVSETDPGVKGDTVTNVSKPAILETGVEVQVPLFVSPGDKIVVDTREARYVRRA
ncbi:elongation factor P [Myxococcota bacterium]